MSMKLRAAIVGLTLVLFAVVVSGQNSVSVLQWGVNTAVVTGSGTATGALRVEVANNGTGLITAAQATAANLNATVVGTGTFATQAASTQSGTWTVQPGNTPNTTGWLVSPVDSGNTSITNTTAHAIKNFPVDPATGTALVVPSSSNGTVDSGTTRVAIASNNTAVSGMGVGATGSAPPVNAVLSGGLASGATGGLTGAITVCDLNKGVNVTTGTTTLMVTGVSGRQVRVCSFHLVTSVANNVQWISGTGATCGTGTSGIGGGGTTAASGLNLAANGGIAIGSGLGQLFTTTATGDSLCLVTSASAQLSGIITYTIY